MRTGILEGSVLPLHLPVRPIHRVSSDPIARLQQIEEGVSVTCRWSSPTSIHLVALLLRLDFFFVGDDVEPTQLIVPLRVFVRILQHEKSQRLGNIDDH